MRLKAAARERSSYVVKGGESVLVYMRKTWQLVTVLMDMVTSARGTRTRSAVSGVHVTFTSVARDFASVLES